MKEQFRGAMNSEARKRAQEKRGENTDLKLYTDRPDEVNLMEGRESLCRPYPRKVIYDRR